MISNGSFKEERICFVPPKFDDSRLRLSPLQLLHRRPDDTDKSTLVRRLSPIPYPHPIVLRRMIATSSSEAVSHIRDRVLHPCKRRCCQLGSNLLVEEGNIAVTIALLLQREEKLGYDPKRQAKKARAMPLPLPIPPSGPAAPHQSPDHSDGSDVAGGARSASPADLDSGTHSKKLYSLDESGVPIFIHVRKFSAEELQIATHSYRPNLLLGEGGFGKVYLGILEGKKGERVPVAIKRLNLMGLQGEKEWLTEVELLSQLCHPALVELTGYSADPDSKERSLVYEFMGQGSLERHLFGHATGDSVLSWHHRMQIAVTAAQGLAYLHDETRGHQQVIYRDFKASNILLADDFTAKLSDFGLAREAKAPDMGNTHFTTAVMGTYGYTAPEYLMKGHLSSRSDVYSFGVVLLEVISGLQSMDKSRPAGQHNLVQWAQPFFTDKRRLYKLLDPRLEGRYSIRAAQTAADIAAKCLNFNPRQRPSMDDVVSMLTPLVEMSVQELNAVQASEKTPSGMPRSSSARSSSLDATSPKQ